jgi:hypothetical protein
MRAGRVKKTGIWGFGALLALSAGGAGAQDAVPPLATAPQSTWPGAEDETSGGVTRGDTVTSRPRPDYDPAGIRAGGFLLFPALSLQEAFNSNIFYTQSGAESDFVTSMQPGLALRSNWGSNALNFNANSNVVKYISHPGEDFNDYTAAADGRIDIYDDARLLGGAGYYVRHLPRFSPENVNSTSPIEYDDLNANLVGEKEFNALALRLANTFDRYHYDSAVSSSGTFFNEGVFDHDEESTTLRAGYELAPLRQIYALGSYNWRNYQSLDTSGFDRNSRGYTLGAGTQYDLTGIIFADVFAGYRAQNYADPRLASARGPAVNAKLIWNVTRLTTITGDVDREVQETTLFGTSSYFATTAGLHVDHELLRNLLLNAYGNYERDSFEGINRTDNYYRAGLGAKYLIDRNFSLSGGYAFTTRNSNVQSNSFDDHLVFVQVNAQL